MYYHIYVYIYIYTYTHTIVIIVTIARRGPPGLDPPGHHLHGDVLALMPGALADRCIAK